MRIKAKDSDFSLAALKLIQPVQHPSPLLILPLSLKGLENPLLPLWSHWSQSSEKTLASYRFMHINLCN